MFTCYKRVIYSTDISAYVCTSCVLCNLFSQSNSKLQHLRINGKYFETFYYMHSLIHFLTHQIFIGSKCKLRIDCIEVSFGFFSIMTNITFLFRKVVFQLSLLIILYFYSYELNIIMSCYELEGNWLCSWGFCSSNISTRASIFLFIPLMECQTQFNKNGSIK